MSGLETAGVVLGALPLIISALEHYAEGVRTARRFWQYKAELRSLILQIRTEQEIFVNTLERLLIGVIRIERIAEYLSHPGGELWRNPDLDEQLQQRLRGSHEVYVDNVRGMNASLRKMMDRLALDSKGKPQFTDLGLFKQEYKRLKFSLSKSDFSGHMSELRAYNHALSQLTQQSLTLESARAARSRGSRPNFKALQERAKGLYVSLRSCLTCAGGCRGHAIKLRLENRSDGLADEDHSPRHTPFRIIFLHASKLCWEEAEVQYIEHEPKTVPLGNRDLNVPIRPRPGAAQSSRLGFQSPSSRTATLTVVERQVVPVPTSTVPMLDLCKVMQQLQQAQASTYVGFLEDSSRRKHRIYPVAVLDNQKEWAAYSLRQILTQEVSPNCRLTQNHKLRIAVDLASSILQLYKTPWLDENWSNADVYFVQRPGSPPSTAYEHPYVHNSLPTICDHLSTQTQQIQRRRYRVIRNQTLYNLGILLIELWYGLPIEKLQNLHDLDCAGTPGVVWCTAARLVESELKFEAGKQYSDAVRRCIHCDFDRSNMDLDDERFQQIVFDGVVVPLQTTLRQFSGESI